MWKFRRGEVGLSYGTGTGSRLLKSGFTAPPHHLFSGADFALIPSRDEPFGLVAVEFGCKGALGVGFDLVVSDDIPRETGGFDEESENGSSGRKKKRDR